MFERYNFGGVYVAIQAVLALYAQGALPSHALQIPEPSAHESSIKQVSAAA